VLAARNVKSTGSAGLGTKKVTTTGAVVPGVNAGIITTALTGVPTTVKDCNPVPALTWSTVTEPGPLVTPKEMIPPGARSPSVTVVLGVQVSAHRTLIKAAWNVLAALKVKSTARPGLVGVKVTTTGACVPRVNGGMLTVALVGVPTTVSDCNPVPALTWSTVTEPGPLVTPKVAAPLGNRSPSVTVVVGVQTFCVCAFAVVFVKKTAQTSINNKTKYFFIFFLLVYFRFDS
jgi:hypothetical protein